VSLSYFQYRCGIDRLKVVCIWSKTRHPVSMFILRPGCGQYGHHLQIKFKYDIYPRTRFPEMHGAILSKYKGSLLFVQSCLLGYTAV
jgi:hypothetical protein